jgi:heme exporter protein A
MGGRPVAEARDEFHARLLYLGHAPAIKDDLSALENLQIAAAVAGRPLDEATALAALRRIGLAGREDLPSRVLSQGQKRRVALARLLCSQARLWILDEPFVALDVAAVDQLCTSSTNTSPAAACCCSPATRRCIWPAAAAA